ncbi:MAG: exosortase/archaeosortase family protein [Chthoniobacteraceae bacterium]
MENTNASASNVVPTADRPDLTPGDLATAFRRWTREQPLQALLAFTFLGTFVYFYGILKAFFNETQTVFHWTIYSWNDEGNMQHGWLVFPIFLGLLYYHRNRLREVPKKSELKGLWLFVTAIVIFVIAVRTVQPRVALFALPFFILGSIWYLWGRSMMRLLLFPSLFLLFMINSGFIENTTFKLQFLITGIVGMLSNLVGVHILAIGTTITASDNTFNFEIVGGCSGIRSLFAMAMLTGIYVHVFQRQLWKKVVIFAASLIFALIGNVCRIFTVILVARFLGNTPAEYVHDYSDFVFFPCALGAMIGFARLLNLHLPHPMDSMNSGKPSSEPKSQPVRYDY